MPALMLGVIYDGSNIDRHSAFLAHNLFRNGRACAGPAEGGQKGGCFGFGGLVRRT